MKCSSSSKLRIVKSVTKKKNNKKLNLLLVSSSRKIHTTRNLLKGFHSSSDWSPTHFPAKKTTKGSKQSLLSSGSKPTAASRPTQPYLRPDFPYQNFNTDVTPDSINNGQINPSINTDMNNRFFHDRSNPFGAQPYTLAYLRQAPNQYSQYNGDNYTNFTEMPNKEYSETTGLQWDPETAVTWRPPQYLDSTEIDVKGPDLWNIRRYSIQRKKARFESMAATIMRGDGTGSAGWGRGKGEDVGQALQMAEKNLQKHMVHLWRYEDKTLGEGARLMYRRTKCLVRPHPRGIGMYYGSWRWRMIFASFGITDVSGRWFGSQRRAVPRIRVAFMAIAQTRHPVQIADCLGMRLFHPRGIHRKGKAANWVWGVN